MPNLSFEYDAYYVKQTASSKPLIMFAAPAPQIEQWVGIPQRSRLDGGETVGFQRQENRARVKELAGFFDEERNVVQNPLLAALQDTSSIEFLPFEDQPSFGTLKITTESLAELTLRELIEKVIVRLEERVPVLKDQPTDQARLRNLIDRASEIHDFEELASEHVDDLEDDFTAQDELEELVVDAAEVGSVLLSEETQLVDFYQELKYRAEILRKLSPDEDPGELLGFTKEAMIGYLQPVVLVDGQHRLRGAVMSAAAAVDSDLGRERVRSSIESGLDPDTAHQKALLDNARSLPVSLLLDESPSEHVFQFVVVNQKATPMTSALLGTIVSTSLSREELEPVAKRLTDAGIRLEDSRAVAYLTRSAESPFRGLVQTGIAGDDSGLLPWSVLNGLTSIFRELAGGKLYHQTNDYARIWRRRFLEKSALVSQFEEGQQFQAWSAPDGPWRDLFIKFFSLVKERFGSDDPGAPNYWGNTRSNLYNKISLTILAADYFQYLTERQATINSPDEVTQYFEEWLDGVNDQYFAREWKMGGLKKDQIPVQRKWAEVWFEYRKNPERIPRVDSYRPS